MESQGDLQRERAKWFQPAIVPETNKKPDPQALLREEENPGIGFGGA